MIIGFDPGIQVTGWGAITIGRESRFVGGGVIRTPQKKSMELRLDVIFTSAMKLISEFKPSVIAVEDPFVGKSAASALTLGQARGVILLAGAQSGIEVAHYSPREIKSSVVGNGSASKEQVQFMVQRLLRLSEPPKPLDTSDAIAVALCHNNRMRLEVLGKNNLSVKKNSPKTRS
ncbi:MAG: crossover junction endodeoxyribonuclease RuvC [Candidatus Electryonea clarkiae]|nr:crossover junction endodeoxyribonuclease RuvC [Candidatus Electryonea clarkiae]MDP8287400.1 crossover junction endodeoxyribonuclease RuvC [Candidatus Electryonea clarkiae]